MTDKKLTRLRRARKARLKMHELEVVRLCVHPAVDPQQHRLRGIRSRRDRGQALDLDLAVDDDAAHTDLDGTPDGLDPATGLGLVGYPWSGKDEVTSHLGTASLNGVYTMFGRQHEAVIGVSASRSST